MKKEYKLIIKYPRLPLKFESGDIVYYNALSKAYVREKFPHYAVDVNEVENNPDFWEEVKQPLFVTDDGVELFTTSDLVLVVNSQFKTSMWSVGEYMKAEKSGNLKVFYRVDSADKYIEDNKPKPLFITEDGVEYTHLSQQVWGVSERFEKRTYWVSQIKGTKVKAFYHESNADEYIWRNKPVFSYEDMIRAKHSSIITYEDIEKAAKERSKK